MKKLEINDKSSALTIGFVSTLRLLTSEGPVEIVENQKSIAVIMSLEDYQKLKAEGDE